MRFGDPLPKKWTYLTIAVAVILGAALIGGSSSAGAGVVARVVVLAVAFAARMLYSRSRR
jgi:hypothetical protein